MQSLTGCGGGKSRSSPICLLSGCLLPTSTVHRARDDLLQTTTTINRKTLAFNPAAASLRPPDFRMRALLYMVNILEKHHYLFVCVCQTQRRREFHLWDGMNSIEKRFYLSGGQRGRTAISSVVLAVGPIVEGVAPAVPTKRL